MNLLGPTDAGEEKNVRSEIGTSVSFLTNDVKRGNLKKTICNEGNKSTNMECFNAIINKVR